MKLYMIIHFEILVKYGGSLQEEILQRKHHWYQTRWCAKEANHVVLVNRRVHQVHLPYARTCGKKKFASRILHPTVRETIPNEPIP